jgi:hypothetical protein
MSETEQFISHLAEGQVYKKNFIIKHYHEFF